jgi:hypothetical protein
MVERLPNNREFKPQYCCVMVGGGTKQQKTTVSGDTKISPLGA